MRQGKEGKLEIEIIAGLNNTYGVVKTWFLLHEMVQYAKFEVNITMFIIINGSSGVALSY